MAAAFSGGRALERVWLAASSLAAGAFAGFAGRGSGSFLALLATGIVCVSIRRPPPLRIAGMALVACAAGALSAAAQLAPDAAVAHLARSVPRCEVEGRAVESAGPLGVLVAVDAISCDGSAHVRRAGEVIVEDHRPHAGSSVRGEGWLVPLGSDGFAHARRRAGADAVFAPETWKVRSPPTGALRLAAGVRDGLTRSTSDLGESGALLRGLTIGDTTSLPGATLEHFRRSGLSHLLAVSGSNVAIVLGAVALLLRRAGLWIRVACCGISLLLFVLIVGPEPSVLRAAAMGAVALVALAAGRRAEPLHALGLGLIALVAFRPEMVFAVGLHLSLAATAGLILWTSHVADRLHRFPRALSVAFGATVAAQFAVAPILVLVFGRVSVVGPVANLVAFPAVAPATILSLAGGVAAIFHPGIGELLARAAAPFAAWILWAGVRFGSPSWAAIDLAPGWGWALAAVVVVPALRTLRHDEGSRGRAKAPG